MYKFNIGEQVLVADVVCIILEREMGEQGPDYLCKPVNENEMILGQWQLGPGWIYEHNISVFS